MTYEYECTTCKKRFEKFFRSFSEAQPHEKITDCPHCGVKTVDKDGRKINLFEPAKRVPSVPLGFALYGDPAGYSKPSTTKRWSTKTYSRKDGNSTI
jgi:putative FmdB family regulatory protein